MAPVPDWLCFTRLHHTRRGKQDKNFFNWTADAFFKQSILSSHLPEEALEVKAPQLASNKFAEAPKSSTFAKPAPTKVMTDQTSWRRIWRAKADAISFAFTDRCRELIEYEEHVGRPFDDKLPSFHRNVINYDKAVRQLIGSQRDILFDESEYSEVARIRNM
ncbi:hypothetical protein EV368DRAFT_89370 [Lentinula lateritia]|nr:hypothetical protein EV368DRAFT_89370 [Lentinula lateritia]